MILSTIAPIAVSTKNDFKFQCLFPLGAKNRNLQPRNPYWKESLSTVDLLVLTSLNHLLMVLAGNTKRGSITVPLTSCLTGLDSAVWQLTILVFICKTDESIPVKQEVNSTVILPPLVFPGIGNIFFTKHATITRRSNVPSLPLQLVFPAWTIIFEVPFKKTELPASLLVELWNRAILFGCVNAPLDKEMTEEVYKLIVQLYNIGSGKKNWFCDNDIVSQSNSENVRAL